VIMENSNVHTEFWGFIFVCLFIWHTVFEHMVSHLSHASSSPHLCLSFQLVTSFLPRLTPASITGMTNVCKHIQLTWRNFLIVMFYMSFLYVFPRILPYFHFMQWKTSC
jgi:hypothetical protein